MVSLILPVKNEEKYISECIRSIQNQTLHHWQLVIVDDHSSDNTLNIITEIAKCDHRIEILKNKGEGVVNALNTGWAKAKGHLIGRVDGDDIYPAKRLEQMSEKLLESPGKTVVTGLVKYFSKSSISEGYKKYEMWLNELNIGGLHRQNIYRECVIASPNWLARTEYFTKIGGFGGLEMPEDYHLVFRFYENDFKITSLKTVTLEWRDHDRRTSKTSSNYSQETFFKLKIRHFLKIDYIKSSTLVVWGSNLKSKLVTKILSENGIPFIQLGLKNYQEILTLRPAQLLICVYPKEKEKERIEDFLNESELNLDSEYWFL